MKKITIERKHIIYALCAVGALVLLYFAFYAGAHCGKPEPVVPPVVDTSTVSTQEAAKAREADQKAAQQIKQLEADHKEVIEDFDQAQKQEYERIKKRGPKEVARWLTDFNKGLKP